MSLVRLDFKLITMSNLFVFVFFKYICCWDGFKEVTADVYYGVDLTLLQVTTAVHTWRRGDWLGHIGYLSISWLLGNVGYFVCKRLYASQGSILKTGSEAQPVIRAYQALSDFKKWKVSVSLQRPIQDKQTTKYSLTVGNVIGSI